ncbi:MAG: ATP-binding protein, partial [Syntrophobacteria bacterium]
TKSEGQGLGLGLSMVEGIVERHKGAIEVTSEVSKGTTFTLKFPTKN